MEAKTMSTDIFIFGCFGWLSPSAVHSADCRFGSRMKRWIHVSSIVTHLRKNSFLSRWNCCKQRCESSISCFWSTVRKHITHSFLCSCKMVNTLASGIFNSSAIPRNFNLQSAKTNLWRYFGVFRDNSRIWANWAFSIICVSTTVFKVSIPPLNRCFLRSIVWNNTYQAIALLEQYFPIRKQCFINTRNSNFSMFWKFTTVASLK